MFHLLRHANPTHGRRSPTAFFVKFCGLAFVCVVVWHYVGLGIAYLEAHTGYLIGLAFLASLAFVVWYLLWLDFLAQIEGWHFIVAAGVLVAVAVHAWWRPALVVVVYGAFLAAVAV